MKVDILTREYPPHVYGGAGVHAEELSKVLAERIDVTVRAFDGKRTEADIPAIPNAADAKGSLKVVGYDTPSELADANPDRLGGDKLQWGRYYDSEPRVMCGNVVSGHAYLQEQLKLDGIDSSAYRARPALAGAL